MRRYFRSLLSFLLTISIALFSTSCSWSGKFDLVKASKRVHAKEVEIDEFARKMGYLNRDNPVYVHETGKDADEFYDKTLNRFGTLPDVDICEGTGFYYPLTEPPVTPST